MALTVAILLLGFGGLAVCHFLRSPPPPADDGQIHWQKAQAALAVRDFPEAINHLLDCLQSWPYHAGTHFLLARTSLRARNFSQWKVQLDRAEILGWPKKQIDLERRLRRAQVGDVWDVESSLIELLNEEPPEEVIILEALVLGFLENDRLTDVIAFTTTWANRYPMDWVPPTLRGNAKLRFYGRSSDAAKDFERVLELKPNEPAAHLALAQVLANQGEFQEAIPHFQSCLASQPADPIDALLGLGNCQYSMGHTEDARASLEQLLSKHPDHATGCFLQAKVELADGRQEEALKWLQKADTLSPDEADVTNALLLVCRQLSRNQDVARYQHRLEKIHLRNDKLDRLLTVNKNQPDDPETRLQLGKICLERGHNQEASHWFQGILYKNPNHLPTLNALVDYYEKMGKLRLAAYYRRKAEKASGLAKSKLLDPQAPKSSETPAAK